MDIQSTILAQYAKSPHLNSLIYRLYNAVNPAKTIDLFYNDVMNPLTAKTYGLDIWGQAVGIPRVIRAQVSEGFIGWEEADDGGGSVKNWDNGTWYNGQDLTANYRMTDQLYRQAILAKAYSNITDCSTYAMNHALMLLYGDRGRAYIHSSDASTHARFGFKEASDGSARIRGFNRGFFYQPGQDEIEKYLSHTITICHTFPLTPAEGVVLTASGALPRPTGYRLFFRQVKE